ncbi:unnamed protein product [Mesocestoides corti]|nr:unnamed protein product [Mesocestoides corti]
MEVFMSTTCYASLNAFAFGDPEFKEGLLIGSVQETSPRIFITAAMPCALRSGQLPFSSFGKPIGIFRCREKKLRTDISVNDLASLFPGALFFCLIESDNNNNVTQHLFKTIFDNGFRSVEPIEFHLFPESLGDNELLIAGIPEV